MSMSNRYYLNNICPSISYLSYQQDQLPPSISPGFRDVVSGVVPLLQVTSFSRPQIYTLASQVRLYSVHHILPTQHCDTSMPPPPIPPPAPSQPQQQQAAPPSPLSCCAEDKPLTFDSARLNARRKERYIILNLMSNELFLPG